MLVLDDPCVRHFPFRIVHHRIALVVRSIQCFHLKPHRAVFQFAEPITVIFINGSGKHHLIRQSFQFFTMSKKITAQPCICSVQQTLYQHIISADGNPLVFVIKIVIVENQTHGQPLDDESRKLCTFPSPLLLGITFYQFLVNVLADKHLRLLF